MVLFAAGFNAFSQLSINGPAPEEPEDLFSFTRALEAERIERPVARLSYTLVRRDGRLCVAGVGPGDDGDCEAAYTYAEAANGEILTVRDGGIPVSSEVGARLQTTLTKYASASALKAHSAEKSWPCQVSVQAMAAFDAGFAILYRDGTVATLGDARCEECLGRDVTEEPPAGEPGIVSDLASLGDPVRHVSAGGYNLAALTESGGIYIWGMSPGGAHRRRNAFSTLGRVPNYSEVDDGKDVQDMAVGESHAIALTTDGSVYVIRDNSNGQIGLGKSAAEGAASWTKVALDVPGGYEAVAVAAGLRSSFVLTAPVQT